MKLIENNERLPVAWFVELSVGDPARPIRLYAINGVNFRENALVAELPLYAPASYDGGRGTMIRTVVTVTSNENETSSFVVHECLTVGNGGIDDEMISVRFARERPSVSPTSSTDAPTEGSDESSSYDDQDEGTEYGFLAADDGDSKCDERADDVKESVDQKRRTRKWKRRVDRQPETAV